MAQPKSAIIKIPPSSLLWKPMSWCCVALTFLLVVTFYKWHIQPILIQSSTKLETRRHISITPTDIPAFKDIARPITRKINRVFYNRVPKCGSSAILDAMYWLGILNQFNFMRSPIYMDFRLDSTLQHSFVKRFMNVSSPMIYERHLHYIDFKKFGGDQPVYMNLIRDPIDRMVSWYYFRRYQEGHEREMTESKRSMTFDQCILTNHSECMEPMGWHPEEGYFKIIPFFCGQDEFCQYPTQRALDQAMKNVKEHYLVVGYMEEINRFLEALQFLLPHFFHRSTRVFQVLHIERMTDIYRSAYKLPVSHDARALLRTKLDLEYTFYYFIHGRFRELLKRIDSIKIKRLGLESNLHQKLNKL